jgi:hypothetical protein
MRMSVVLPVASKGEHWMFIHCPLRTEKDWGESERTVRESESIDEGGRE